MPTLPCPKIPKQPPKNRRLTPSRSTCCAARKRTSACAAVRRTRAHAVTLRCAARRVEAPRSIESAGRRRLRHPRHARVRGLALRRLRGLPLDAGARLARAYEDRETCVVVLSGRGRVSAGGREWRDVGGRATCLRRAACRAVRSAADGVVGRGGGGGRARGLHRSRRARRRAAPARAGGHAARVARQRTARRARSTTS